jgi:hypothetical protein
MDNNESLKTIRSNKNAKAQRRKVWIIFFATQRLSV